MKTFIRIVGSPVENLGIVEEGAIYRSAQPSKEGYDWLRDYLLLETSCNLRMTDESELIRSAAIAGFQYPLNTIEIGIIKELNNKDLNYMVKSIHDYVVAGKPLLVHCRQGHDRTGTIVACYRMKYQGWTFKEAFEECVAYGFNPLWHKLKNAIEDYGQYVQGEST